MGTGEELLKLVKLVKLVKLWGGVEDSIGVGDAVGGVGRIGLGIGGGVGV